MTLPATDDETVRHITTAEWTSKLLLAALLAAVIPACDGAGARPDALSSNPSEQVRAESATFAERFVLVREVVPEQSDANPLVRLSGLEFRADGAFLIADASERNVRLFDATGQQLAVFGGGGEGPGEFQSPRFPRFAPDGEIHVGDAQASRVEVFGADGSFRRSVRLPDFSYLYGFAVLADGDYLVLGTGPSENEILFRVTPTGEVRRGFLPVALVVPDGEREHPAWGSIRGFSLGVRGDTAFVSSSVFRGLWRVELSGGAVRTTLLDFPGYVAPRLPDPVPASAPDLFAWAGSVHLSSTLSVGERSVHLPFVQGVLNFGDPMILLSRDPSGRWHALRDAPPVIAAHGDTLIAIQDPDADSVTLGLYHPIGERRSGL